MENDNVSKPLISVLIPAFNSEKYLAQAIESALAQTWVNKEVIVVDDGSKDRTLEIAKSYEAIGVKVYSQPNKGASAARNLAYSYSTGDYIKFLDADDLISFDMLEKQIERLKGSIECIASSEWGRFYNDTLSTFRLNPESVWQDMKPIEWLIKSLEHGPNMTQPGIFLIPRNLLEKAGLWDERLSLIDDFEFFTRVLLCASEVRFTPHVTLYYRSGVNTSLSTLQSRRGMESAWLATELGTTYLLSTENSVRTRQVSATCFQIWAYNFYPYFPDLVTKAEKKIKDLGGSQYPLPAGKWLRKLSKILGWKWAKQIHLLFHKMKNAFNFFSIFLCILSHPS
jgi:glycosyltransferase involved in cell wall biosynthesis